MVRSNLLVLGCPFLVCLNGYSLSPLFNFPKSNLHLRFSFRYLCKDGLVARKLNQCSTFGGLLDMVTDRCSTMGLLFVLSCDYMPQDKELGFPFYRLVRS